MPYLEGVTVKIKKRIVDCNLCPNLDENRICKIFNRKIKRTVDYCIYFPINEVYGKDGGK